jgi:hypothetical protein
MKLSIYKKANMKIAASSKVLKPLSSVSVAKDFVSVYQKTMAETLLVETNTPHRVLSLRPSQMPFCPREFFVAHAVGGLSRNLDLAGAFYTSVGTVVHSVMQAYLCQSGRFLADYFCAECDTWHRYSYKHECCGFPTQYHEIEINYKGIKGHIDAVYRDRKGRLWILDFKTTSVKAAPKKQKNPGVDYVEQIETYAVLFELQYKQKIEGIVDAFIVRDNPRVDPAVYSKVLTDVMRSRIKSRLSLYKKMHRRALDASTWTDVKGLLQFERCTNSRCEICPRSDPWVLNKMKYALRTGLSNGNVPIRAMAERALAAPKPKRPSK